MNYLSEYQPFATKKELNEVVMGHIGKHVECLNDTDLLIITILSRHAVKYPGVAHLKAKTLETLVKKSSRTIRRSVQKLEQLNIMKRQPFIREKSGGYGANLYIFLALNDHSNMTRREEDEESVPPTVAITKKVIEPNSFISNKEYYSSNTYVQTSMTHYERFKNHIALFIHNAEQKMISRLYGIYRAKTICLLRFTIYAHRQELFEQLSLQSLTILFQATKKKNIRNMYGYYDGVLQQLIDQQLFA